jgi:hypothetical protein
MTAYISVLTDKTSRMTKNFALNSEGKLIKNAAEHLIDGTIQTHALNAEQLSELIPTLNQNQCLCLGSLKVGSAKDFSEISEKISCNQNASNGSPVRSKEFLNFTDNNWLLLDVDGTDKTPDEVIEILTKVDPAFDTAELVVVPSSSSYLYHNNTLLSDSNSFHIYLATRLQDPAAYGQALFDHLILNGHGYTMVTATGRIVVKTLIDKSVFSPEREIFAAKPVLGPGLESKRFDHIQHQPGEPISQPLTLNPEQDLELRLILQRLREQAKEESEEKLRKYNELRAKKASQINGTTIRQELANLSITATHYDKQGRPIVELASDDIMKDQAGQDFYIRDLLTDPPDEGTKFPDPHEPFIRGDEATNKPGRGVATYLRSDMIFSHAHAGIIYLLRWKASDLVEYIADPKNPNEIKKYIWKCFCNSSQSLLASTSDAERGEVADAFKKALGNIPGAGVGTERKSILNKIPPVTAPKEAENDILLKYNQQYGIVNLEGKVFAIGERWREEVEHFTTTRSVPSQLEIFYKRDSVLHRGQMVSTFNVWMSDPQRNTFEGAVFRPHARLIRKPGEQRVIRQGGIYNFWQGYIGDMSKAKYPEKVLDHVRAILCHNYEDRYEYMLNWLAHLFQFPNKVSSTALVLRSRQGTGKNIFVDNCVVKVLGCHAMTTTRRDDIVGKFNASMGMNVFVHANEAFWAGDKTDANAMKAVITDEFRTIEFKGVDSFTSRNCSSFIISSNESWVAEVEHDDRRYVYFGVSQAKVKDKEYFTRLGMAIEEGEREGFLEFLLKRDISKFDITAIPESTEELKQVDKIRSADPIVKFMLEFVEYEVEDFKAMALTDVRVADIEPKLRAWVEGDDAELVLSPSKFYDLFIIYCERYKVRREFQDQAKVWEDLRRVEIMAPNGCDPLLACNYPVRYEKRGKKNVIVTRPRVHCKNLI